MIACRDFVPKQLHAPDKGLAEQLFILPTNQGEYETFEATVGAANAWIDENSVRVINVETVVLPNIWEVWESGSQDPALRTFQKPTWHQFVRVWYGED